MVTDWNEVGWEHDAELKAMQNKTIEECARALEDYHHKNMGWGEDNGWFVNAVAAIRALKKEQP